MPSRSSSGLPLTLRHALALGALHGAAELLPVSSSAHMTTVPWLLGWPRSDSDAGLRKAFEVAVHAGTALALLAGRAGEPRSVRAAVLISAVGPPAAAGYLFERPIEERLSRPSVVAGGLAAGALVMALAERAPQTRHHRDADLADGLWLGAAQALALVPGVSRRGATLAAARRRGFTAADADRLSWQVGLPVLGGAAALKALRLLQCPPSRDAGLTLAAGGASSFASTLLLERPLRGALGGRSLLPYAAYRLGMATLVVSRLRRGSKGGRRPPARP